MSRRKWWFIGLGLALLAACVLGWNWSERPPYMFMKGARLWAVNTDPFAPETGVYSETYVLNTRPEAVARAAVLELGLPTFDWGKDEKEFLYREPETDVLVKPAAPVQNAPGSPPKHPPSGTKTLVTICYQEHTPLTRVRAWLSDHGL